MAQVPKNEGFSVMPNERAAFQGTQYIDPGIKFETPDFSRAAERLDKFQMQQDETRADAMMMQLERQRIDNEKSFKGLLGEDAMQPDAKGRGLVQRYDEDLRKYGTELTKGLTVNQQRLFNQKAEKTYLAQYGTARQHVLEQNHKWQNDTYVAKLQLASESARAYYDKHEEIDRLRAGIASDVRKLGDLNGWSEEIIQMQIKAHTSSMMVTALNAYLEQAETNPGISSNALGFLQKNAKHMLGKDVLAARKTIDAYQNIVQVDEAAKHVKNMLYVDAGSVEVAAVAATKDGKFSAKNAEHLFAGYVMPIVGGQQKAGNQAVKDPGQLDRGVDEELVRTGAGRISLKDAKATAARLGEEFNENDFNSNIGYNARLAGKHFSHLVTAFAGDIDQTMAAFFSDEESVKSALEQAKRHGEPAEWLTYLPPDVTKRVAAFKESFKKSADYQAVDSQGNPVSVFSPEYNRKFKRNRIYAKASDLYAAAEAAFPRMATDPAFADKVKQRIDKMVQDDKQEYAQTQTNVMNQIWDKLVEHNGDMSKVPQSLLSQIDTNQYRALETEAKAYANKSKTDDPQLYAMYFGNEDHLRALTPEDLAGLRPAFREDTYDLLKKRWATLHEKDRQNQQQRDFEISSAGKGDLVAEYAKVSDQTIKGLLKSRVDPDEWKELERKPDWMNMMIANGRRFILQNAQAGGLGTAEQELGKLADSFVTNKLNVFGDIRMLGSLRYKDLPNRGPTDAQAVVDMLARGLIESRVGVGKYTDDMLTDQVRNEALSILVWTKELPFGIPPDVRNVMDASVVNHIIKAHGGKEPSGAELVREYVISMVNDLKIENKTLERNDYGYTDRDTEDYLYID